MSTRAGYISLFLMNPDASDQRTLHRGNPGDLEDDCVHPGTFVTVR